MNKEIKNKVTSLYGMIQQELYLLKTSADEAKRSKSLSNLGLFLNEFYVLFIDLWTQQMHAHEKELAECFLCQEADQVKNLCLECMTNQYFHARCFINTFHPEGEHDLKFPALRNHPKYAKRT